MTDSPQTTRSLSDRLAEVQVGPRSELEVSRHLFGGEPCYVVRDPVTFHSHKLSREDYQVFAALKADQPLHSILARLIEQGTVPFAGSVPSFPAGRSLPGSPAYC